ncbi:hypothetical protein KHA80_08145 [Anaerobacillus sp. HL2]|nr:hypothetical protein KHA80_08145 [Anaerobacillus sp. HL2]
MVLVKQGFSFYLSLFSPLFFAIMFIDETLRWFQLVGGILAVTGILFINTHPLQRILLEVKEFSKNILN